MWHAKVSNVDFASASFERAASRRSSFCGVYLFLGKNLYVFNSNLYVSRKSFFSFSLPRTRRCSLFTNSNRTSHFSGSRLGRFGAFIFASNLVRSVYFRTCLLFSYFVCDALSCRLPHCVSLARRLAFTPPTPSHRGARIAKKRTNRGHRNTGKSFSAGARDAKQPFHTVRAAESCSTRCKSHTQNITLPELFAFFPRPHTFSRFFRRARPSVIGMPSSSRFARFSHGFCL